MRMFSGHVLPRNASNFTCSHRDLKNFPGEKFPSPAYRGGDSREGEEIKGFLLPLKEGDGKESKEARSARRGKGKARGSEGAREDLGPTPRF